jgi:hypothetical protein
LAAKQGCSRPTAGNWKPDFAAGVSALGSPTPLKTYISREGHFELPKNKRGALKVGHPGGL